MGTPSRTPQIRIGKFRLLSIVLAFSAAVGLIFGTAGFTAMDADRGVEVNVTDDDNAYLVYEPLVEEGKNITTGESTEIAEYQNQFTVDLKTFEGIISSNSSEATIEAFSFPDQLDRGSAGTVTVTLNCSTRQDVELSIEVTGSGSGASVTFDRTLSVTCVPNQGKEEAGTEVEIEGEDEDESEGEGEDESEGEDGGEE